MPEPIELPHKAGGVVPYFFYDLYGRILPGLFLVCGLFATWAASHKARAHGLACAIQEARAAEWTAGAAVILGGSFVIGFLLSEATRLTLWRRRHPVSLERLREYFGAPAGKNSPLEEAFESYFRFRLDHPTEHKAYLIYCARLCEFVVANRSAVLDSVAVRVAAEEVLSRNILVSAVILVVASACNAAWVAALVYLVVAALSYASWEHYQRKGILEKFQSFFALTRELSS